MSVSVVAETLFLACIYILYPMFYMYHVTGGNKVVYCIGISPYTILWTFANYHVLKHQLTNLILSSLYIPTVLKSAAKLWKSVHK